jgi:hypothetical protein
LSQTTKTAALETVAELAEMLDELWRFVDEAGRDRAEIDVAFGTPDGGTAGSTRFRPDDHLAGLHALERLGVTWTHAGVPGDSLAHALEALQQYGETVIARSRT